MRAFHATDIENVASIRKRGLLAVFEGVYLSDSVEGAAKWKTLHVLSQRKSLLAVVEVEINPKRLVDGSDHSPLMQTLFGAGKSLLSPRSIPKSAVKRVHYLRVQLPPVEGADQLTPAKPETKP